MLWKRKKKRSLDIPNGLECNELAFLKSLKRNGWNIWKH